MLEDNRQTGHGTLNRIHDTALMLEIRFFLNIRKVTENDVPAGMGQACNTANHDHILYFLGKLEGPFDHIFGFLEISRFQQRYFEHPGKVPRFAFVGAGKRARIVTGHQHHSPAGPGDRQVQQEVRSHVDTVLFHDTHGSQPGKRTCRRNFHGHFLIDRPFDVQVLPGGYTGQGFNDLG